MSRRVLALFAFLVPISVFFSTAVTAQVTVDDRYYVSLEQARDACYSFASSSNCSNGNVHTDGGDYYLTCIATYSNGNIRRGYGSIACSPSSDKTVERYEFHYILSGQCPLGDLPDATGECVNPNDVCLPGSMRADCRVECPAIEYTYYLNGVLRHGRTAEGTVGHGQSCPTPIYPSGSQQGCIGTPGTCNTDGAIDERIPITVVEETVTENPDGSTTTETTTRESGGHDSTNTGGGGSPTLTATGIPVDPNWDYKDTVNIGDSTYARCEHGGLVDSTIMCDYVPPQCSAGQFPTVTGCVNVPRAENPHYTPPQTITKRNPDGSSTTIIHEGSKTVNQGGGGQPGQGDKASTGTASGTCSAPPQSTGDAQLNAILRQQWEMMCLGDLDLPDVLPDIAQTREQLQTELSETFDTIKSQVGGYFDFSAPTGGCVPNHESIYGVSIDFSVCRFIGLFQQIGTLLVALAALSAVAIVTRSKK